MSTDPEVPLTRLVDEVFRLAGSFSAAGDAIAAPVGLSAARWLVLGALQDGARTIADVARVRGLRRQSVRESVLRLERDGLLERTGNGTDARAQLLQLNAAGRAALEDIEPRRQAWTGRTAAAVPPAEIEAALAVLQRVRRAVDDGRG